MDMFAQTNIAFESYKCSLKKQSQTVHLDSLSSGKVQSHSVPQTEDYQPTIPLSHQNSILVYWPICNPMLHTRSDLISAQTQLIQIAKVNKDQCHQRSNNT